MRVSNSFIITRRELPNDENVISSQLLIKSGMIYKNDNGIYSYLPLGYKVIENIKKIIREEMKSINASEVLMPSLVSNSVFEKSKRNKIFGDELYTLTDRSNKVLSLCPMHEELFACLASSKIQSYKDLHFSLFQISNKFRDEEKPEYGLIRKKEFIMADAYSYDADEGGLDVSYDKMFMVFKHIFNRLSINAEVVDCDEGESNGIESEQFDVISDFGDNEIVRCTNCTYTCSIEDASSGSLFINRQSDTRKKELVSTPNVKSIKELSDYLNVFPNNILKSLICKVDGKYKMFLLRGESELNIKKLRKLFKTNNIEIPTVYELEKLGTKVGYIGPINCTMEIIADNEVKSMHNFICGSNKENYHFKNVNYGRDFRINRYADIKLFDEHCVCPKCKNKCKVIKGFEVGQIFKLGKNYSELYNLTYKDEQNKDEYVHMGSYQIGVDRCLSAIVENNHDDKGIVWPLSVAPYKVIVILANLNDQEGSRFANSLHDKLNNLGIETLFDDRKESIGVKFNDADLIGIPIRVTIGNQYSEDKVEVKLRSEKFPKTMKSSKVIEYIQKIIERN